MFCESRLVLKSFSDQLAMNLEKKNNHCFEVLKSRILQVTSYIFVTINIESLKRSIDLKNTLN